MFPSGASPLSLSYDGHKSSYVAESSIFFVYTKYGIDILIFAHFRRSMFPSGASPLSLSYDGPKSSYAAESAIFIVYEQIYRILCTDTVVLLIYFSSGAQLHSLHYNLIQIDIWIKALLIVVSLYLKCERFVCHISVLTECRVPVNDRKRCGIL